MKDSECLLGFDIGGTKCAVILGRIDGDQLRIEAREAFSTPAGADVAMARMIASARSLLEGRRPVGIGLSCGGPLDSRRGMIQKPPNLPDWDDVPIVAIMHREFGVSAFLQNDANACALAEWKWGAGQGTRNMIFLTFGTGMGAGLILDGKLYSGTNDMAGEVGHMRLAEDGPEGFGKKGSFEGFCSGGGIARLATLRGLEKAEPSALDVFELAHAGDPFALRIVRESAHQLGRGLAILVDILNPEVVVIGSIFARQETLLRPLIEATLIAEALKENLSVCRIVAAALGEQIGDYAALSLAAPDLRTR